MRWREKNYLDEKFIWEMKYGVKLTAHNEYLVCGYVGLQEADESLDTVFDTPISWVGRYVIKKWRVSVSSQTFT